MKGIGLIALLFLLAGCGAVAPPTIAPTATIIPSPTTVPTPTNTPLPTATPTPKPTPTPAPCSTADGRKVYDLLQQFAQEWDDALKLANNTPRMSLAPQIANLQAIRRKVQTQQWPTCAQEAYDLLVGAMDKYIDGYIAFLGQTPGYLDTIKQANNIWHLFLTKLDYIVR